MTAEKTEVMFISRRGFLLTQPHECPLCHYVTMFYRMHQGATYCYMCAPEDEEAD